MNIQIDHAAVQEVLAGNINSLLDAFKWEDSPQGFSYWSQVLNLGYLTEDAREKLSRVNKWKHWDGRTPEERTQHAKKMAQKNIKNGTNAFMKDPDFARKMAQRSVEARRLKGNMFGGKKVNA